MTEPGEIRGSVRPIRGSVRPIRGSVRPIRGSIRPLCRAECCWNLGLKIENPEHVLFFSCLYRPFCLRNLTFYSKHTTLDTYEFKWGNGFFFSLSTCIQTSYQNIHLKCEGSSLYGEGTSLSQIRRFSKREMQLVVEKNLISLSSSCFTNNLRN